MLVASYCSRLAGWGLMAFLLVVPTTNRFVSGAAVGDGVTVATYNIRTASRWALRDGGDDYHGRTWPARRRAVAKTIVISGAAVVGTQGPFVAAQKLRIRGTSVLHTYVGK